eukprot:m.92267 g.92267  ORF g.92267 m.92267 type:complete len:928 (-) comp51158_c1_seq8:79-2862(-)
MFRGSLILSCTVNSVESCSALVGAKNLRSLHFPRACLCYSLLVRAMAALSLSDLKFAAEDLGKGSFGRVTLATHKKSGERFAVKQLQTLDDFLQQKNLLLNRQELIAEQRKLEQLFVEEFDVHQTLTHPNIVQSIAFLRGSDGRMNFVMEFCDEGTLEDVLKRCKENKLDDSLILEFMAHTFSAVNYLHKNDIVHVDLKPANILRSKGVWKLADFGLSRKLMEGQTVVQKRGNILYRAPEFASGSYTKSVDLWSIGLIAAHVCGGVHPFRTLGEPLRNETDLLAIARAWNRKKLEKFLQTFATRLSPAMKTALTTLLDMLLQPLATRMSSRCFESATSALCTPIRFVDWISGASAAKTILPSFEGDEAVVSGESLAASFASARPAVIWRLTELIEPRKSYPHWMLAAHVQGVHYLAEGGDAALTERFKQSFARLADESVRDNCRGLLSAISLFGSTVRDIFAITQANLSNASTSLQTLDEKQQKLVTDANALVARCRLEEQSMPTPLLEDHARQLAAKADELARAADTIHTGTALAKLRTAVQELQAREKALLLIFSQQAQPPSHQTAALPSRAVPLTLGPSPVAAAAADLDQTVVNEDPVEPRTPIASENRTRPQLALGPDSARELSRSVCFEISALIRSAESSRSVVDSGQLANLSSSFASQMSALAAFFLQASAIVREVPDVLAGVASEVEILQTSFAKCEAQLESTHSLAEKSVFSEVEKQTLEDSFDVTSSNALGIIRQLAERVVVLQKRNLDQTEKKKLAELTAERNRITIDNEHQQRETDLKEQISRLKDDLAGQSDCLKRTSEESKKFAEQRDSALTEKRSAEMDVEKQQSERRALESELRLLKEERDRRCEELQQQVDRLNAQLKFGADQLSESKETLRLKEKELVDANQQVSQLQSLLQAAQSTVDLFFRLLVFLLV